MKKKMSILIFALLPLSVAFVTSCSSDDDPDPQVLLPKLDGLYVYGTNTVAEEPSGPSAKMSLARLDENQGLQVENMDGVYGKFIYIGAGSTIEFAYVLDEEGTVYGAEGGGSLDSAVLVGGAVKDLVIHGSLVADADPISITNEGLYYAFVNINTLSFILMEVKAEMIGDATELQWTAGTPLPLKTISKDGAVFEGTGINLMGATGYRYRFNDGWHVYADNEIVTMSSMGVPSYGEAWDTGVNNIGFYLDNAAHKETGIFTITLTFTASTGEWEETKTKTGDLLVDYSADEYGWFGNAYYREGTIEGDWSSIDLVKTPTIENDTLYNWNWTLELIEGRSFVLRQSPDGAWITWGGAAKFGTAFDNNQIIKEDGQDNYYVAVGGTYIVTFTINAADEGRWMTIEPNN